MNRNDAVQVVLSRAEYLALLDALERPRTEHGRTYPTLRAYDLACAIDKLERADRPTLRPVA